MASSLFGTTENGRNNGLTKIANIVGMLKNSNSPNAMVENMVRQNPKYNDVMNYVQKNGGDPKAAFYKMAAEKGVDPNQILGMFK